MNFKTTYTMFVVLIAVLAIFGIWQAFGSKPGSETYVMASMHKEKVSSDDIDGVIIDRVRPTAEKLVFVRGPDKEWRLVAPFEDRVEKFAIGDLIRQVIDARREQNADVDSKLSNWGLDTPAAVVTLRKGADKDWTLNLGNESAGGAANAVAYVSAGDRPKDPAAVKRSDLAGLFKNVNEFRQKSLLADSSFDITSVKLHEPKHDPVAFDKNSEGRWRFESPAFGEADYEGESQPGVGANAAATNITGVRDLLQAVSEIRVDSDADFGESNAKDADLAAKGLAEANPERMRIDVKTLGMSGAEAKKEPVARALLIGKKADDKGEKLFARMADSKNVVKIAAKNVDKLDKVIQDPALLRNRELVQIDAMKTSSIDAIDIKLADSDQFKLRRGGEAASPMFGGAGNWKIYEAGKVQEADQPSVQALINALTAKRLVKDFPDPKKSDADLGLDKPVTVVSLWVDGIKKEEPKDEKKDEKDKDAKTDAKTGSAKDAKNKDAAKDAKSAESKKEDKKDPNAEPKLKDDKPAVKLSFGRREKDIVYVRRDAGGETVRLAVPASVLDKAGEGRLAYLDRKLPSYGFSNEVTKLVLARGSDVFELARTKDDKGIMSPWKITQPKAFAGRTADAGKVERVLDDLRDLQAEKLVAEKPTAAELERFGLTAPRDKVTLTLTRSDKKTEDHAYLFGKESEDKVGVYAKRGSADLVFVVRKTVADALQGDLLDPTVFAFDAAKVHGLRLTGWHDINGIPFTLDLERKPDKSWTAKSPAEFKADAAKVDGFVQNLTNLRAVRFLPPSSPPKPEYKLAVNDGALDVVVTVDGEKEQYVLTIGGLAGMEGFYARTSKLPSDIFILPKGNFEPAKSKPVYFKKE